MLVDFQRPISGLGGQPMVGADGKPFLLVMACQEALTATFQDEQGLAGAEKVKRFVLAMKLENKLPVDVSIEEAAQIKSLVAKAYGPLIVGRVWEALEAEAAWPKAVK